MDFQPLTMGDDAFNEEADDRLARLEIGSHKAGSQLFDYSSRAQSATLGDLRVQLLRTDFRHCQFGSQALLFGALHPLTKGIQWHGTDLVRVEQAVLLPRELLQAAFRTSQPLNSVG